MEKKEVVVASITWARDEAEENLLRSSLTLLANTGVPVYLTDAGSGASFLEFLNGFPQFHVFQAERKGLWAQITNSLSKAYEAGSPYIFYTEPDKRDFFQTGFRWMLDEIKEGKKAGVITASRSAAAFQSFPAFQQMTETTINNCCTERTGLSHDFTYGPFILSRSLISYLDLVKEDIGWGWRPYVFCVAHRLGMSIQTITGDFYCPVEQRHDTAEERVYRMKQLQQNIQGIVTSSQVPV